MAPREIPTTENRRESGNDRNLATNNVHQSALSSWINDERERGANRDGRLAEALRVVARYIVTFSILHWRAFTNKGTINKYYKYNKN